MCEAHKENANVACFFQLSEVFFHFETVEIRISFKKMPQCQNAWQKDIEKEMGREKLCVNYA